MALADSGETEALEFRATTGTRREAAQTLCAFLNEHGGQVLFGVSPTGQVASQQVGERTMEQLSGERRCIEPPAFPEFKRIRLDGRREVIVVSANPGVARPYAYRGTAFRRVGNTTLPMSADAYHRMQFERMPSEQRWENQPADGWSIDDLELAEVRATVAEAVRRGRLAEPPSSSRLTCYADWGSSVRGCCSERRPCCSARPNVSKSRCRSACSALLDSGAWIGCSS
ncbi:MAG: ATP-binding protein [Chloroflexi bacterium]|nr:ATP-binding protein [Chloroflexota bacterium]